MRILHVVNYFPVLSETFVVNQIVAALEDGHDVRIHALHGLETGKAHPDVEQHRLLDRATAGIPRPGSALGRAGRIGGLLAEGWRGGHLHRLAPLLVPRRLRGPEGRVAPLFQGAPLAAAPERFDVIHAQFGTCALAALRFLDAGLVSGRLVTTFRGYDISMVVSLHGRRVYDELFRRGDRFLVNCDHFRRRLLDLGCPEDRLRIHYSGLDLRRFPFVARRPDPDGTVRIATVGRLVEKKGYRYALGAVARLAEAGHDVRYDILGAGPEEGMLRAMAAARGIADRVTFHGAATRTEVVAALSAAHLFLAPSVTAANGDQDAPTNVLKEAMACGLPVVSTWHGGIPELVEDGVSGCLAPERDEAALADRLARLIAHPEHWPVMGAAARARVEDRFDLRRLNAALMDVYRSLADETLQPPPDTARGSAACWNGP